MPYPKRTVRLRRGDRAKLEGWARSRTLPQRMAERARVLLASAEGTPVYQVSAQCGVSIPTVRKWLSRYEAEGLAAMERDRPRSGRPKQISTELEAEIVRMTVETQPPVGTHWSTRVMAQEVGVNQSTISRLWRAHGLKPHRVRSFKVSNDPEFTAKLSRLLKKQWEAQSHRPE